MKKKVLKIGIVLLACAALVAFDQWTKMLVETGLRGTSGIVLIPGVFELQYVQNTGIAFGLFQGNPIFFGAISCLISLVILFLLFNVPVKKRYIWVLIVGTLLIAGSIGNLIDRLRLNYVIDFLYFSLIDFPVFNVADCYVTVSVFLLAFLFLFIYKDEEFEVIFPAFKSLKKDKKAASSESAEEKTAEDKPAENPAEDKTAEDKPADNPAEDKTAEDKPAENPNLKHE